MASFLINQNVEILMLAMILF